MAPKLPRNRARLPRLGGRWLGLALAMGVFALVVGAGAAATAESDTVGSYWRGLWWAISLIMTEGFIGAPPRTIGGAVISVVLMVTGFAMLSIVSAALASIFVRSDEQPQERQDSAAGAELLRVMQQVLERLDALEGRMDPTTSPPARQTSPASREPEVGDSHP